MAVKVKMLFGEQQQEEKIISFDTQAEMNAYISGVDDMNGWLDYSFEYIKDNAKSGYSEARSILEKASAIKVEEHCFQSWSLESEEEIQELLEEGENPMVLSLYGRKENGEFVDHYFDMSDMEKAVINENSSISIDGKNLQVLAPLNISNRMEVLSEKDTKPNQSKYLVFTSFYHGEHTNFIADGMREVSDLVYGAFEGEDLSDFADDIERFLERIKKLDIVNENVWNEFSKDTWITVTLTSKN